MTLGKARGSSPVGGTCRSMGCFAPGFRRQRNALGFGSCVHQAEGDWDDLRGSSAKSFRSRWPIDHTRIDLAEATFLGTRHVSNTRI